jgi:AcrR family transcriptional regulator
VLEAAMSLADARGLEAVSMREVARRLGVEAMSLYKHVANKDDILDGLVDRVMAEMEIPAQGAGWRAGLRARALSARRVLLRHRWAAMLIESRVSPGPARLRHHNAVIQVLREAGFSIELAYSAFLTLDSYIYGFVLQEVWSPMQVEARPELIENLRPAIAPSEYPYIVEMMTFVMNRSSESTRGSASIAASYATDFEFGLDLVLDGLERAFGARKAPRAR